MLTQNSTARRRSAQVETSQEREMQCEVEMPLMREHKHEVNALRLGMTQKMLEVEPCSIDIAHCMKTRHCNQHKLHKQYNGLQGRKPLVDLPFLD